MGAALGTCSCFGHLQLRGLVWAGVWRRAVARGGAGVSACRGACYCAAPSGLQCAAPLPGVCRRVCIRRLRFAGAALLVQAVHDGRHAAGT